MDKDTTGLYSELLSCRICGSKRLVEYLNLGELPLANRFVKKETDSEPRFPLKVLFCQDCSLSQLSGVVDPKFLFSFYPYRSSISKTFKTHCADMADKMGRYFPDSKNALAIDIASNDGCLLSEFQKKGFRVFGIDPAKNLVDIAVQSGIPSLCGFWGPEMARQVIQRGKAQVITATNVFAHVHDVHAFVKNIQDALAPNGVVVIEFHYAVNLIRENAFDTIYHEHLSYFLLKPLIQLFKKYNLRIFDADRFLIHGGALRIYATHKDSDIPESSSVAELLDFEAHEKFYTMAIYREFAERVEKIREDFTSLLTYLKKNQKKVCGFGAAAKGNTLLNYCKVDKNLVDFIVDETPEKQGWLYAGTHIPIFGFDSIETCKPDFIIIFPWNFSTEIIRKIDKLKSFTDRKGQYIIPIPSVHLVSSTCNV